MGKGEKRERERGQKREREGEVMIVMPDDA